MNNIHKMIRIIRGIPPQSRQRPQPITKLQEEEERMIYFSGENPPFWKKENPLTKRNFKTGRELIPISRPRQAITELFSFSKRDCCIIRGFFTLTVIEIMVPNGLRFFQLTIQPLRQGCPPQIVASWFINMFDFRSMIVDDCFKKHSQNLLEIIKKSIYRGLNLSEFARELVPIEFDITMHTDSPWPDSSEDDDRPGRGFNPLLREIKPSLNLQRKRPLCIEDVAAVKVSDDEPERKKRRKLNPRTIYN